MFSHHLCSVPFSEPVSGSLVYDFHGEIYKLGRISKDKVIAIGLSDNY